MTEPHPGVAKFLLRSHYGNKILILPQHKQRIVFYLNPISEHDMVLHTQQGPVVRRSRSRSFRSRARSFCELLNLNIKH